MKLIERKSRKIKTDEYLKRLALEEDYEELIDESFILKVDGDVKVIFKILHDDCTDVLEALKGIRYEKGRRTRGLVSTSRIIGYRPRSVIRADYCSSTSLAKEAPKYHAAICQYAQKGSRLYEEIEPTKYKLHAEMMKEKVLPEYTILNSIFTSGIVNKDNQLNYHFDTGNFNDVMSCMFTFRNKTEGGYLSIPDYNIGVNTKHNSVFIFDGQSILHGVTPIRMLDTSGFRYSIVFYSLKGISKCLLPAEELARVRRVKTEREKMRHNMTPEHKDFLKSRYGKQ